MNRSEIAQLLAMAAAYDRRTVGEADVEAWHAALDDLRWMDARDAVIAHYRGSREWIMPADIREHVRRIRGERLYRDPSGVVRHLPERRERSAEWRAQLRRMAGLPDREAR